MRLSFFHKPGLRLVFLLSVCGALVLAGCGGSTSGRLAAPTEYTVLYNLVGGSEGGSYAGLIMDGAGDLYGTTSSGGASDYGTVFKLAPNGGGYTETLLHSFTGRPDGIGPHAGLITDSAGNLYGTTINGGSDGFGTVFKLDSNGNETVLHSFNGTDGAYPYGGLIMDGAGNLYGTTENDGATGASGNGMVFKLDPGGNETVLYSFNGTYGANPYAGLITDSAGNLYGTTSIGGAINNGTVFKLAPNGSGGYTETVLHSFSGTDGQSPIAGLIMDGAGNLYGTTTKGGANSYGTVFKLAPNGSGGYTETVLHSFSGTDGQSPVAGLIMDGAGNLYGTTVHGGANRGGTVFMLAPNGNGGYTETLLHSFTPTDGVYPSAGLIMDSAGNLYGTTSIGGAINNGTVFELSSY